MLSIQSSYAIHIQDKTCDYSSRLGVAACSYVYTLSCLSVTVKHPAAMRHMTAKSYPKKAFHMLARIMQLTAMPLEKLKAERPKTLLVGT